MLRTHTCGELRATHVGDTVTLCGWVDTVRDHGGVLFIDLRDHSGIVQVVCLPGQPFYHEAAALGRESVLTVTGAVVERQADRRNPDLPTGDVEIRVRTVADRPHADTAFTHHGRWRTTPGCTAVPDGVPGRTGALRWEPKVAPTFQLDAAPAGVPLRVTARVYFIRADDQFQTIISSQRKICYGLCHERIVEVGLTSTADDSSSENGIFRQR